MGGAIEIFELARTQGPQERGKAKPAENERRRDHEETAEDGHEKLIAVHRSAFLGGRGGPQVCPFAPKNNHITNFMVSTIKTNIF